MNPTLSDMILLLIAVVGLVFVVATAAIAHFRRQQQAVPGTNGTEGSGSELPEPADRLTRHLRAAGVGASPVLFVVLVLAAAFGSALFLLELFGGMLLPAVLAFVLVGWLLYNIVVELGRYRALKFEERLVDAVDLMVGALRSGESPTQALSTAAKASEAPVRTEFEETVQRLGIGLGFSQAASRMLERYDGEGVRMFVSTLSTKWAAGGDLAPVLRTVAQIMRDRIRNRLRLQSQLAGARLASFFVAISPYVILLAFHWRNPGWIERLLEHPAGPPMLFMAVCMQIIGFLWLHRLMRVEL